MFEQMFEGLKTELQNWVESGVKQVVSSLEENLKLPEPSGAFQPIRRFHITDKPITQNGITVSNNSWRIAAFDNTEPFSGLERGRTVRLFELPEPETQECLLACRAWMMAYKVEEKANLHLGMCKQAEFFGVNLGNVTHHKTETVSGTTDWQLYEILYHFKKEQSSSKIQINIEFETKELRSSGILWIRDIEVLQAPIKSKV